MAGDPPVKGAKLRTSGDALRPVAGATGRPSDLGDITLPAGPALPSAARAAVSGWLNGHAPVRVRGGREAGSVWFEVGDAGLDGAVARRAPARDGAGGFGLHLVDALASEWGISHVGDTQVWFSLPLRRPAPA